MSLVLMLPLVAATPSRAQVPADDWPLAILSVAALGIAGTGFGAWAFTKLLQDEGPLFAGMVTYLIPTIAIVWAWFDSERVSPKQLAALAGVLAMVAIVQYGAAAGPTTRRAVLQPPGDADQA
jgi:drug/metabolite transporter (DMT)-like permease